MLKAYDANHVLYHRDDQGIRLHNFDARSILCLTDSIGIQEEYPFYGLPVLCMKGTINGQRRSGWHSEADQHG